MSITADLIRGHTDAIILNQLASGDSYGYRINLAIRAATEEKYALKEATLYTAFRRLEEAGYIRSYWGDEESGARRRYYSITNAGQEALAAARAEWQTADRLIGRLLEPVTREGETL